MLVLCGIGKLNEAFLEPTFSIPLPRGWMWSGFFYLILGALFFYLGAKLGRRQMQATNIEPKEEPKGRSIG